LPLCSSPCRPTPGRAGLHRIGLVSQNGTGRFNGRSLDFQGSLRIELDDELLLDGHGDVLARGLRLHRALEPTLVEVEPGRDAAALDRLQRLVDADDPLALVLPAPHVYRLTLVA